MNPFVQAIVDSLMPHLDGILSALVSALLIWLRQKWAPSVATPLLPPPPADAQDVPKL